MKTSYRERDYAFGQAILTLRTGISLTQAELATHLGVSRRAVGEWEGGSTYPKAEHLKKLIALAVKQRAFARGSEISEIRALWKAAHQKEFLDEHWLSTLLEHARSLHLHLVPKTDEESRTVGTKQGSRSPIEPLGVPRPRVDWGDALALPCFYGREEELAQLSQWVVQERCRVVSVLGIGGIGKSALSVSLMYQQAEHFEVVIFRSLRDAPDCSELVDDCLQVLSPQSLGLVRAGQAQGTAPAASQQGPTEQRIGRLLEHLRTARVLMVLDNLECLLEAGDVRGHFRPGFEGYGQLLRRVAEAAHQSCVLITSREKPAELRSLEGKYSPLRSLRLSGLDATACKQLFAEKEVVGTQADQERLIALYGGNPLALKIVAETIIDLFGGEISELLAGDTLLFGSVTDLLEEQFIRLSALEQSVLCWLAIAREPVTLDELHALLVFPLPRSQVLEAVDGLHRRSLVERGKRVGSFTLQSVVLEYVTGVLITGGSREIRQHRLDRLIGHGLSQATAREYVRQTQERLLLSPLLVDLQNAYSGRADGTEQTQDTIPVEEQLLGLLEELRGLTDSAQGYGPANLIALLRLLRGNLNGLDLSRLCIRGAYLQDIEMQEASLSGALIRDTVLTEAVSATWAVAISQDGTLWAASGMQGKVRVWGGVRSPTLHLIWQAHTDIVQALAFSPNGRILASGSMDHMVKLWDVRAIPCGRPHGAGPRGVLLWMDWYITPKILAFSPDGSLLAGSGADVVVSLWDTRSGKNLQRLEHPAHVFAVAWSPDGSLLASSCFDGQLRLWQRQKTEPSASAEIFSLRSSWETSPVTSLAFAPDGRTLVSADLDCKVKLWEVGSGQLLYTFEGETSKSNRVVWSPDGHTLASCSYEQAIWLWDVEARRHRATLLGHTSDINSMAFTPDSSHLLSGSSDGTLRVWDVQSGQCVRIMQGYAVFFSSLDWSPDGTHLVSGGTDGPVTIWDMRTETPSRELRGHTWVVWGVGWSPDGQLVASCGWDKVTRLWNPTSGDCVQSFDDPASALLTTAWNPDGSLLAVATFLHGMYVWAVREGCCRWIGEPGQLAFLSAAWSPNGSLLAGGGSNGKLCLWESADGTLRERLPGHHGSVASLAWSPDGTRLASGSGYRNRGELFVWDVQSVGSGSSPSPQRIFVEHSGMVQAVAWSRSHEACPRGDQLISGGSDGILRWWDVPNGECIRTQRAHQGTIRSLRVSPDGKRLASSGDDGAIRIWDLTSYEHLRTLRRDRPYERLNITGIRGLNEAQKATLQALGAVEDTVP
jgi:WD40 repeat protein/transcriptional regulator with XRE-family HTH domain